MAANHFNIGIIDIKLDTAEQFSIGGNGQINKYRQTNDRQNSYNWNANLILIF